MSEHFVIKLRKSTRSKCANQSATRLAAARRAGRKKKTTTTASSTSTSLSSCNISKRCYCSPQPSSPIEFPPIWSEFRSNGQLCDGTVRCEDGTEFKVHRAILSAVSPYFKALFTNSINRNQPENRIAVMNAPSDIFRKLMDFAYAGHCLITDDTLEPLIRHADQYEVLGVVQLCCQYILDHLRPENCLGMLRFARHYFCVELERRGRRFVRFNFGEVLKCGDGGKEFERLPVEDVIEILGDDDLNVRSEEAVFEAVQKWVEHDIAGRAHHLPDLLKVVRMGNLSAEYLTYSVLQWPPIDADNECKSLIGDVFKLMDSAPKDATLGHHPQLRPRVPHDILFAVGGWTAGSPTNFIETYDTRADRWLLSRDNDLVPRAYHGICTLDGLIYMIGGFDGNEHFNTVRCFDPATHLWKDCACMYYPRCYVSVAVHGGRIYAMGGYNGRIRMSSAERYDPQVNQWQQIQPMQRQRSDASAAALDDKVLQQIYIVGGFNGTEVMNSAEVYDTLTNQWSFIPHMISARSGVSLVAFKDTLYALGGFNGFTRLTSGEKYSPNFHHHCSSSSNNNNSIGGGGLGVGGEWVQIAEMFSPRSNFATVILDEYIFVIGGFNGSTTINYVECYDSEANEWFDAAPMNLNRSALSACVISGLQNAKDYSLLGRSVSELGQGASGCQAQQQQDTTTAATTTPAP